MKKVEYWVLYLPLTSCALASVARSSEWSIRYFLLLLIRKILPSISFSQVGKKQVFILANWVTCSDDRSPITHDTKLLQYSILLVLVSQILCPSHRRVTLQSEWNYFYFQSLQAIQKVEAWVLKEHTLCPPSPRAMIRESNLELKWKVSWHRLKVHLLACHQIFPPRSATLPPSLASSSAQSHTLRILNIVNIFISSSVQTDYYNKSNYKHFHNSICSNDALMTDIYTISIP